MKKLRLRIGDVVQLNPETVGNKMFGACFMTVSELKSFGCQGYVQALGENGKMGGAAYYRAKWEEMELAGSAVWMIEEGENEQA